MVAPIPHASPIRLQIERPSDHSPEAIDAYARKVFDLMFRAEIQQKLEMKAEMYKVGAGVGRACSG